MKKYNELINKIKHKPTRDMIKKTYPNDAMAAWVAVLVEKIMEKHVKNFNKLMDDMRTDRYNMDDKIDWMDKKNDWMDKKIDRLISEVSNIKSDVSDIKQLLKDKF